MKKAKTTRRKTSTKKTKKAKKAKEVMSPRTFRGDTRSESVSCTQATRLSAFPEEGIDVSHDNNVDWTSLDPSIHFALIKATDGGSATDSNYRVNITAARHTGLKKIGSYHFFRPDDTADAQFQKIVGTVDLRPDDFSIAVDVENADDTGRRLTPNDVPVLSDLVSQLFNQYRSWPIIYTNSSSWSDLGQPISYGSVNFVNCPLWIADPNNNPPQYPRPWIVWTLWQYGLGSVAGVTGDVDLNRFAGSFDG